MQTTAPRTEGRTVPAWLPLVILVFVLIVAAGIGLLAAHLV
jgi:hypothetical protein